MGYIIDTPCSKSGRFLGEIESKQLLKQAGIAVTEPLLARSADEAVAIAGTLGYPVVLKIVSSDIVHKSDAGGVVTGLDSPERVVGAYQNMVVSVRRQYPEALIDGISVQPQALPGVEVVIGMTCDSQFGPVIMFGLGGIWVEVLNDISLRIAPLTREDAAEMIRGLKGYKLLEGYRGSGRVDTDILEDWLLKISALAMENPRIREMDINPVFAYPTGAVAVDARILIENA